MDAWEGLSELRRIQGVLANLREKLQDERDTHEALVATVDLAEERTRLAYNHIKGLGERLNGLTKGLDDLDQTVLAFMQATQAEMEDYQWARVVQRYDAIMFGRGKGKPDVTR